MNKLTAVVIGCGKRGHGKEGWAIGHMHGSGYQAQADRVKLVGVDLSPDNLQAFGDAFGLPKSQLFASTDAMYAQGVPDIVSICTWPGLHAPMAIEAMERGVKGLIIEKPLALDVDQIREIQRVAKKNGAVVAVTHQRRYEPPFQVLRQVTERGLLGTPLQVHAQVGNDWDVLSWTTHWFDMANYLLGANPEWLMAGMDVTDRRLYNHAIENASVVYAQYPEGKSGVFVTGPGAGGGVRLIGPRGIAYEKNGEVLVCSDAGIERIPLDSSAPASICLLVGEVLAAMNGGPEPLCSLNRCAMATEMAYAAHESARTARKVALPMAVGFAPLEVMQHPARSQTVGLQGLLYADAHFGSGGREGLAATLEALTGKAPRMVDAEKAPLRSEDLADVDFLVIYHTQKEASAETRQALTAWVEAERPLLIVHAGLGAWPEWNEYLQWCGLVWAWGESIHPHTPVRLLANREGGVPWSYAEAWLPRDEVFAKLKPTAPVVIDLVAEISTGESYPAAWHQEDKQAIGVWMPGHRADSWLVPAMRSGFEAVLRRVIKRCS